MYTTQVNICRIRFQIPKFIISIVASPAAFGNGTGDLGEALVEISRVNVCKAGEKICVNVKDKQNLPKPTK